MENLFLDFDYETETVTGPQGDMSTLEFQHLATVVEYSYEQADKTLLKCVPNADVWWWEGGYGSRLVKLISASRVALWGGGKEIYILVPETAFIL